MLSLPMRLFVSPQVRPKQTPYTGAVSRPEHSLGHAGQWPVAARSCASFLLAGFMLAGLVSCAAKRTQPPATVVQQGQLPPSGALILRSGLEWTDERSPAFQTLRSGLVPLLAARGFTLIQGPPSRLAPLPRHFPQEERAAAASRSGAAPKGDPPAIAVRPMPDPEKASGSPLAGDEQTRARVAELSAQGKLRPLRLSSYSIPEKDADLPGSVMAVTPVDSRAVLFALSQKRDFPLLWRAGAIPGRLPKEMGASDPALAEYALVIRFAALRAPSENSPAVAAAGNTPLGPHGGSLSGFVTAAGPVRGVGALGPSAPAPSAPPRSAYGGTPGDYARGYEGMSPVPRDFWHRETDFNDRNYTSRHTPPPAYATPPQPPVTGGSGPVIRPYDPILPKPPLPGDVGPLGIPRPPQSVPDQPGGNTTGTGGGPASEMDEPEVPSRLEAGVPVQGYLLEMDCYSLAPARTGGSPALIWNCRARHEAIPAGLQGALPIMAAMCLK